MADRNNYNRFIVQLVLLPLIPLCLLIITGGVGIFISMKFDSNITDLQIASLGPTSLVENIRSDLQELTIGLMRHKEEAGAELEDIRKNINKKIKRIDRNISKLSEFLLNQDYKNYLGKWIESWNEEREKIFGTIAGKKISQGEEKKFPTLVKNIQYINEYFKADVEDKVSTFQELNRKSISLIILSLVLSLFFGILILIFIGLKMKKIFSLLYESESQIATILNHIQLGIFSFDLDQKVNKAHSRLTEALFDQNNFDNLTLADIFELESDEVEKFSRWLDVCKRPSYLKKWEKAEKLAPITRIDRNRGEGQIQILSIHFEPIVENCFLKGILVMCEDITQKVSLEKRLAETEADNKHQTEATIFFLNCPQSESDSILEDLKQVFAQFKEFDFFAKNIEGLDKFYVEVHNCKARLMMGDLQMTAMLLHKIENFIDAIKVGKVDNNTQLSHISKLTEEWEKHIQNLDRVRKLLRPPSDSLQISKKYYFDLLEKYRKENSSVCHDLAQFTLEDFSSSAVLLRRSVQNYCKKNPDKSINIIFTGEAVLIRPELCDAVRSVLLHIIRNSCDHGIESRETRIQAGKEPTGRITVCFTLDSDELKIDYEDDGRGIDSTNLQKNVGNNSDLAIIFEPSFSTASHVSMTSGRGMGMAIVKNQVDKVGGTIQVDSVVGRFTRFSFRFPDI